MSLFEYKRSIELSAQHSFAELIMAAMRIADDETILKLEAAFPKIYKEALDRFQSTGGLMPWERFVLENPPVPPRRKTLIKSGKRILKKNIIKFRKRLKIYGQRINVAKGRKYEP